METKVQNHRASFVPLYFVFFLDNFGFSLFFSLLGTTLSYFLNWPPGATIALTATLGYFGILSLRRSLS